MQNKRTDATPYLILCKSKWIFFPFSCFFLFALPLHICILSTSNLKSNNIISNRLLDVFELIASNCTQSINLSADKWCVCSVLSSSFYASYLWAYIWINYLRYLSLPQRRAYVMLSLNSLLSFSLSLERCLLRTVVLYWFIHRWSPKCFGSRLHFRKV